MEVDLYRLAWETMCKTAMVRLLEMEERRASSIVVSLVLDFKLSWRREDSSVSVFRVVLGQSCSLCCSWRMFDMSSIN